MPNPVTMYQCNLCGKRYTKENEAIQCETEFHTKVKNTKSYYRRDKAIPHAIHIEFDNGMSELYVQR